MSITKLLNLKSAIKNIIIHYNLFFLRTILYFLFFYFIGSITQGTPNIMSNHQIPVPLDLRTNNKINPQPTIVVEDKTSS